MYEGYEIPYHYDPLISKLISWAPTRSEAIDRMKRALFEYKITGVKTSIPFVTKIMEAKDFVSGNYDTHFIEKNMDFLMSDDDCSDYCEDIALFVAYLDYKEKLALGTTKEAKGTTTTSPWKEFGRRKNNIRL